MLLLIPGLTNNGKSHLNHTKASSLSLAFSRILFLLEFLTLECLFPIGEAMEVWKHLDSPRKSHKKNLRDPNQFGAAAAPLHYKYNTVPSPDSSSNWIRCSLFFSCRYIHLVIHTYVPQWMLYASLLLSFMILRLRCWCWDLISKCDSHLFNPSIFKK